MRRSVLLRASDPTGTLFLKRVPTDQAGNQSAPAPAPTTSAPSPSEPVTPAPAPTQPGTSAPGPSQPATSTGGSSPQLAPVSAGPAPQTAPSPAEPSPSASAPAPAPTGPPPPQSAPSPSTGAATTPTAPAPGALSLQPSHPLDPLTPAEVTAVRQILVTSGLFKENNGTILAGGTLYEPTKAAVLAWSPGQPLPPRQAEVILRQNDGIGSISTVIVDIASGSVVSNTPKQVSGFSTVTKYDSAISIQAAKQDPRFAQAVAARGLNTSTIICQINTYGYFNRSEDNIYLVPVECYDTTNTTNYWAEPLTGLEILVNVVNQTVFRFIDAGVQPIPPSANTDFRAAVTGIQDNLQFVTCSQPASGSNVRTTGNVINWGNWQFHVRYDQRVGIIVSNVTYSDAGVRRDVMYQGSVSEIYVPYQDTTASFNYKSYFDGGDLGLGSLSQALVKGIDCPANAAYYDGVDAGFDGFPRTKKNMLCVFERNPEHFVWRHSDVSSPIREARPALEVVARFIANSGNYDYAFDWVFRQDGLITVNVATSGILQLKAVTSTGANTSNGTAETQFGTFVNENLIAVNHDHFFNFRLDMDVDGQNNSYVIKQLQRATNTNGTAPRQSYWTVSNTTPAVERDSVTALNYSNPRQFYIANPGKQTRLGNAHSYRLVPTGNSLSVLDPNDILTKRAPWINFNVAVTKYNSSEKFASGVFTNQAVGDQTLANWIGNDAITNTDIGLWYTMEMHHIPTQDQFPVMPTEMMGFHLQPANFFERNPVLAANPFSADNGIYEQS